MEEVEIFVEGKSCTVEEIIYKYIAVREENKALKKQISELESELSVKEDLLKIKNGLCNEKSVIEILKSTPFVEDVLEEEALPFSDEQYEEDRINKLEKRIAHLEEKFAKEVKRLNQDITELILRGYTD